MLGDKYMLQIKDMDWLGVFLIVLGVWLVWSAISGLRNGTSSVIVNLLFLAGGCYAVYVGYQKVSAPAPGLLSSVGVGGRR